ncbi:MAG TPA: amino acid permease, partial [Thermoanaerobaculia bacterium]
RMWYAFARDDGMPGSRWLKRVSGAHRTPVVAILVTCALSVAICLYASAFFVVTSISTICLYLAYGIPIWLNLRNRRRGTGAFMTPAIAAWSLGRWSAAVNTIAVVWIAIITVVFMLPPNQLVLWTMLGVAVLLTALWWMAARSTFAGPRAV